MISRRPPLMTAALLATAGIIASQACNSPEATILQPSGTHPVEEVARIEIVPSATTLQVDSDLRLVAEAFCRHEILLTEAAVVWSSVTPETASVDSSGTVKGLRRGTAVIRASVDEVHDNVAIRIAPFGRTIDPSGGEVSYKDGLVRIVVGAGALTTAQHLSIEEAHDAPSRGPGKSMLVPGTAFDFGPDGQRFTTPVELRFRYDASGLPPTMAEARLRIHRLNGGVWVPLAVSEVDPETKTVRGLTSVFSTYAVLDYRPTPGAVVVASSEDVMRVGSTQVLTAMITEESGAPVIAPEVTWSTSDATVATVDDEGTVEALEPGWVTITASSGGVSGETRIAVQADLSAIVLVPAEIWLSPGDAAPVEARLTSTLGEPVEQLVVWSSSDPAVATVSEDGLLSAHATGLASIHAASGGVEAELTVHVTAPPASVVISPPSGYFAVGEPVAFEASVLDADGRELGWPVTWTASDPELLVEPGVVMSSSPTIVMLTATSASVAANAVLTFMEAADLPGSVELDPPRLDLSMGQTVQVVATVRDRLGSVIDGSSVRWLSGAPAVAEVDDTGLVTALSQGTTILMAQAGPATAVAEVIVGPRSQKGPPNSIAIWPRSPALSVGGTGGIGAAVYDAAGDLVASPEITWTSRDPGVVTVDAAGLLTGIAEGVGVVEAASGELSDSVFVSVVPHDGGGGHEEGLGNNLSWPVVFAEGYGMTGLPVATDPGLRPTADEGITVTELPFFAPSNVADYQADGVDYYLQQGANTWQAEWLDGGDAIQSAEVKWGDNLTHHTWTTHSMIRVETSLTLIDGPELTGFDMTHLYGSRSTEMQGADGAVSSFVPGIFSVTPRLTVQKLDDETLEPVYTAFDGSVADGLATEGPGTYGAEVNVAGRIIYGYNLRIRDLQIPTGVSKYGWWRLTFALDDQAVIAGQALPRGVSLDRCGNAPDGDEELTYTPVLDTGLQRTTLDIWIVSASGGHGGSGGSGGHSGGGGCGGH